MKIRTAICSILLLIASLASAQVSYVTVTATVTDPTGNPYASATVEARLVDKYGNPVYSASTPNGQLYNAKLVQGTLDSTGTFSLQLVPNSILTNPAGTQWQIGIAAPADLTSILTLPLAWTTVYKASITGPVDLSSQISALARPINFLNLNTGQSSLAPTTAAIAKAGTLSNNTTGNAATSTTAQSATTATTATHAQNLPSDFASQSASNPQPGTFTTVAAGTTNPTTVGDLTNADSRTSQSLATNVQTMQKHIGHVCAEDYLWTDTMHGGTDYGAAINAADQAASLTKPSTIRLCQPGEHNVYTTGVIDRPIDLDARGSYLIDKLPTVSPVTVTNATVTAGSKTISVSSTAGLTIGERVGGLGLAYGSYITSVGTNTITVSLTPQLVVNGYLNSSTTVYTSNSLAGLAVGQTVSGDGIPSNTTITTIHTSEPQYITLSQSATATTNVPVALTVSGGTWTAPKVVAMTVVPVLKWIWNASALQNEYGQMIGGSMEGVWIQDGSYPASLRSEAGTQGVQIYGWDGFKSRDLRIDGVPGSGLILGGNVPSNTGGQGGAVRESFFYNTIVRYSGDVASGQSALELLTPSPSADEDNQISFIGGQLVTNFGESATIGTYNASHTGTNGPRLIWFMGNFQIEGGQYLSPYPPVATQADSIHVIQGGDLYFIGGELNAEGWGKSLARLDDVDSFVATGSRVIATGFETTYTVGLTNGSATVTLTSGGDGLFQTDGSWDGMAVQLTDSGSCSSGCIVHLAAANAVANTTTLTLASPYTGSSSSGTLLVGLGGYTVNATNYINNLKVIDNDNYTSDQPTWNSLSGGQAAFAQGGSDAIVGKLPDNLPCCQEWTTGGPQYLSGAAITSPYDESVLPISKALAPNLTAGHSLQSFFGQSLTNNNSVACQFNYSASGSTSNSYSCGLYGNANSWSVDGNGVFSVKNINVQGGLFYNVGNYGIRITPSADTGLPDVLYGSNATNNVVTWHVDQSGNWVANSYAITGLHTYTRHTVLTATLSPAAVPANTCAYQTFTVTGVSNTDIFLNAGGAKPSFQTGLMIGGIVPAGANSVNIQFCNVTAASITPTAGETYTFDVEQ